MPATQPLAVERSVMPQAILPDPNAVENSLYEALEPLGLPPAPRAATPARDRARCRAGARAGTCRTGSPGLFIERRAFLDDGRVVEFTRSFYRGDAYDFVAELQSE